MAAKLTQLTAFFEPSESDTQQEADARTFAIVRSKTMPTAAIRASAGTDNSWNEF